jgi:membrane-bound lytic murein transglycosylase B
MKKYLQTIPLFLFGFSSFADSWHTWLEQIKAEARQQGIRQTIIDQAFASVHQPSKKVKSLAHNQPEKRLSYLKYRSSRVDNYRISIGRQRYAQNRLWIDDIANTYGVDPCFMVSFWGLETSYGSYMGNFPVIQALSTLAYDSNRKDFFKNELFLALKILNDGHVQLAQLKGEWAGASGQPQFLPSSWLKYAVDYDGDGRKDIWGSKKDALASIANYMKMNGWNKNQPWAVFVKLPRDFNHQLEGKSITKTVKEWDDMGVRTTQGEHLPFPNLPASIIKPYGGPTFLAYPNYRMILRYNNSIYYAGSIGFLADKICKRPSETELSFGQN